MNENEVIGNDPNAPHVPAGQGSEYVPLTKEQHDSLARELSEARESERYWANHARAGSRPAPVEDEGPNVDEFLDPADAAVEEIAGDTTEAMIDEFAKKGIPALQRRGMVTRAEALDIATKAAVKVAGELIGRERQKMSSDDTIMKEFPDLKDPNSELFKATATRFQKAVSMDPNARKTPAALYLAADAARESLRAKAPRGNQDGDGEQEAERRARADSQDGRSRGRAPAPTGDDDLIGSEAKQVIAAFGLKDAEFQDSRKATRGRR